MKLYITDLDGTFLDHKASVTILTKDIINRELKNGAYITYATARSIYSASPIVKEIDFSLPVITQNGAFIVDPKSGKQLVTHYLSEKGKNFLMDFFDKNKEAVLVYSYIDGSERVSWLETRLNNGVKRYIRDRKGDKRLRPCKSYEEVFEGEIYYLTLIAPVLSPKELDVFFDNKNGFARNYQADTYQTDEYWYEIYREDVSKANAVKELKALLDADEVICFGDNLNDISMFHAADRCYAVSNACEELKNIATGVIASNNQSGVAVFIANDNCIVREYTRQPQVVEPDKEKFRKCVSLSGTDNDGIGTLNEKQIHSSLKSYFASSLLDKEIKIGSYYADLVTENGIYEIQTQNFKKLVNKLDSFLQATHVTVVYPFHKRTTLTYADKKTGEILKSGRPSCHKCLTDFFVELYRIKQYLNNPNLTICIAELSVENYRFTASDMKRRKSDNKLTVPTELYSLIYLEDKSSYARFIPEGLPKLFTKKEFARLCKISEAGIAIEILKTVGLIDFYGKKGNEFIYTLTI